MQRLQGLMVVAAIAAVLLLIGVTHGQINLPETYRMLVNHGAGWSDAGDFATLEECSREAVLYAKKYSAQAGCAAVSALARQRAEARQEQQRAEQAQRESDKNLYFQQTAAACAKRLGIQIIQKPDGTVRMLVTPAKQFAFDKCMTDSGHPETEWIDPTKGAR